MWQFSQFFFLVMYYVIASVIETLVTEVLFTSGIFRRKSALLSRHVVAVICLMFSHMFLCGYVKKGHPWLSKNLSGTIYILSDV